MPFRRNTLSPPSALTFTDEFTRCQNPEKHHHPRLHEKLKFHIFIYLFTQLSLLICLHRMTYYQYVCNIKFSVFIHHQVSGIDVALQYGIIISCRFVPAFNFCQIQQISVYITFLKFPRCDRCVVMPEVFSCLYTPLPRNIPRSCNDR